MGKSGKISQYRERLDRTLASPELTNLDALKTLIRNQLVHSSLDETEGCSDNLIENRTKHVSSFLDMLRSASVSENEVSRTSETSHGGWKIKEDHEEFRVMYRPGPEGTPFHSLLVEGYVDGTVDTCLCVSWEATLYRKWWPQYSFPPFKITICECLQKIRISEQISLVRVKVTWPMTAREAVVHYVLFEHLQDGLVVVIISTISDLEGIDKNTHGFSKDGIPEAKDVVRIDMMGGFAIQKVTPERSYFRTIANMDLKLDFVPPSLMNFITRQLVGNGFRLYQKAVASVSNHDEDYSKALEAPMYARIREALYSTENANEAMEWKEPEADACLLQQEHSAEDIKENLGDVELNILGDNDASEASPENAQVVVNKSFGEIKEENSQESRHLKDESLGVMELNIHGDDGGSEAFPDNALVMDNKSFGGIKEEKNPESRHLNDGMRGMEQRVHCNDNGNESGRNIALATVRKTFIEIEEEESEDSRRLMRDCRVIGQTSSNNISLKSPGNSTRNIRISSDVGRALETLEKAISMVREYGNSLTRSFSRKTNEENKNLEKDAENDPTHLQHSGGRSNAAEVSVEASNKGKRVGRSSSRNSFSNREIRRAGSRETSHNKITPASPDQYLSIPSETNHAALYSSENGKDETSEVPAMDLTTQGDKQTSLEVNGTHENVVIEGKKLTRQTNYRYCCFGSRYE
ncbi:hypothetical protein NC653_017218 [Populus alba x Populus x berolinensis]|uniref:START domain-containing protein n=2 Tax=Populus alba x Populus x berolinensis TaxID=444605 RepID=A0AAD6W078_9ROSI|nr:hypothetical protein NC653_017218 [Populus alba x Populus x berolinensis]